MKVIELIFKEIAHQKIIFCVGILAITLSSTIATSSILLLEQFDNQTEQILSNKKTEVKNAWVRFKDNVRKTMLDLGFNLVILPENQTLSTPDEKTIYLPENYATKLKKIKLMSINHVLPFLKKKIWWPEKKRWITLYGTPGEIQIKKPNFQTPMVNKIDVGKVSLGKGIYESMNIKEGDTITFMNRKFFVQECRPAESFEADEQFRVDLKVAQEILKKNNLISGIMAINCVCADPRGIIKIRKAVQKHLPNTQILENKGNMIVRVEERARAAKEAEKSLKREEITRNKLRSEKENFNAILIPIVTTIAIIWLGIIVWLNVRQRRSEIAILRTIGWTESRIFSLIIIKAFLMGLIGGILGVTTGSIIISIKNSTNLDLNPIFIFSMIGISIFIAVLASWLPAMFAISIDPATVLQEDN